MGAVALKDPHRRLATCRSRLAGDGDLIITIGVGLLNFYSPRHLLKLVAPSVSKPAGDDGFSSVLYKGLFILTILPNARET